ncbi:MAG TPA: iron-sulfur cluster assembly protein [Ktedonobacteraceae bacterium]|nr:iron-sulfur cluster assembly protein [Ktedonobacteraceae bacterium]
MQLTDSGATALDTEITEARIYAAISDVLDPELDEPLVKLGFIDRVQVDGADVTVTFKLPTFWCSPNFAYLMAKDLRSRVREVPGVGDVHIALLDHCAEDEVTQGVNRELSFAEAFPDETMEDEHLEELRRTFLRKGFLMRQDALLRQMLKVGLDESTIASLRIADLSVDESANAALVRVKGREMRLEGVGNSAHKYLRRREVLALPQAPAGPLIIDDTGQPLMVGGLKDFMRRSRAVCMNIMFNTALCKGLFQTRYGHENVLADVEGEQL